MCDCVWSCVANCEDICNGCKYYISMNSDEGEKILESYENDVHGALKPIKEKYENLKLNR